MSTYTNKSEKKYIVFNVMMTLTLFLFLLCASTFLVVYIEAWYGPLIYKLGIPEKTGYSLETCMKNYHVLIDYNMFFGAKVLNMPDFYMSEGGAIHFREVKEIFVVMQYTAIATFLLLIPGMIFARKKKTYEYFKWTSFLTVAVLLVLGLAFLIDWDWAFVTMHHILFDNDYWIFDPASDPVIRILPDTVFLTGAGLILGLLAIGLLASLIAYRVKKPKKAKKKTARKKKNG